MTLPVCVTVLIVSLLNASTGSILSSVLDKITPKPIEKFVEDRGYPVKRIEIETADGFLLHYHRIPHGRQGKNQGGEALGHPVLLAHGILQSSALYLAMDDGLAYLLADAGFDVWLTNARGNTYSRNHKYYRPSSKAFWDFSFHEMGVYDLPAAIDYILDTTRRSSLSYVGFSMGTAMFWVMADARPEYMDKVDTMVAMAPIARPSGMSILHRPRMYAALKNALKFFNAIHSYEVRPFRSTEALVMKALCSKGQTSFVCTKMLSGLVGLFPDSIHYRDTYVSTQYMPAGTSVKNIQHFLQIGEKKKFQQYDSRQNGSHDDEEGPQVYDLKKVTCPVFFITSNEDIYATKEDVDWLADQLPVRPEVLFFDDVKNFNHLDYFYSKNVKEKLFVPLVNFMTERVYQLKN